ncbi:hypothetical protein [Streptomyces sp. NBRC 110035]|uniref:hypothetical protein n=1 Tax=Streptomyces sp. NBRC 110035 TaxID=1547867 RepID=UPI000A6997B1|nr:hypothetical protein [Streptomyces sp. NBRC 110035]
MNEMTGDDRRLPPALADVARIGFDHADGDGTGFGPCDASGTAEEATDRLRRRTGNPDLDGGVHRLFGQDGTGGLAAVWYGRAPRTRVQQLGEVRTRLHERLRVRVHLLVPGPSSRPRRMDVRMAHHPPRRPA